MRFSSSLPKNRLQACLAMQVPKALALQASGLMLLVLLTGTGLVAHPFDQVRADSDSTYIIQGNRVKLKLKFPVHAYVNLWVTSPREYDNYVKDITSKSEQKKIKNYVKKHIKIFDGKNQLALKITGLTFERDPYLSDKTPVFILLRGQFDQASDIEEVFIFNELFKEGRVPHFGNAEIEMGKKVFDFQFRDKRYFRYKVQQ